MTPATAIQTTAWAGGSDRPELEEVRLGFIPLTDCASVVMASELGFDRKHGIKLVLSKEASWARVRDKMVSGELHMAHVLYGLMYGVHLGIGGPQQDMAVLMNLNHNGQGITLSKDLAARGAIDGPSLARLMAHEPRRYVFAGTFPTGTHTMWLHYWLAAAGIDPLADARLITVPPRQMVDTMRAGHVDGFSAGEPWNHRAIIDGVGITAATSQDIWPEHPEKVLGCSAAFVRQHPHTCRAVIAAVLEASRWIDASVANRRRMAETIAGRDYIDTSVDAISERILGRYQNGLGRTWNDPHHMKFFADGAVNLPYLSDGMWFMTQYKRWGLIEQHPDYLGVARQINQLGLYREAAAALHIDTPAQEMRSSVLIDGVTWDGSDPAAYADRFAIRAPRHAA